VLIFCLAAAREKPHGDLAAHLRFPRVRHGTRGSSVGFVLWATASILLLDWMNQLELISRGALLLASWLVAKFMKIERNDPRGLWTCSAQRPAAFGLMRPFSPGATLSWIAAASSFVGLQSPAACATRVGGDSESNFKNYDLFHAQSSDTGQGAYTRLWRANRDVDVRR